MISKLVYLRYATPLPLTTPTNNSNNNNNNINPQQNNSISPINEQTNINSNNNNTPLYKISLDNVVNIKKLRQLQDDEYDDDDNENINNSNDESDELRPFYTPKDNKDYTLQFESRFECGNLLCAFKTDEDKSVTNYQLVINRDTNTTGYIQWFFFRVSNTKKGKKTNFTLINMLRKRSLYNNGIKILCYSRQKNIKEKVGWHRVGENVMYYQNNLVVYNGDRKRNLHSLSFDYVFEYDNDEVFFANTFPYSYTTLMNELREIQINEEEYPYVYRKTLYTTLGGNDVDMISINTDMESNNISTKKTRSNSNLNSHSSYSITTTTSGISPNKSNKKGIVIIARQHPGETVGSYVMRGVMEFLLGRSEEAQKLRELYVIKIVPMINPDGVIEGNSRTSYAGCDLNRRWENPDEVAHGEIYYTKEMIMNFANHRKIDFIIDLHGHSGAFNSFFYCNFREENHYCQLFPFTTAKKSNIINFCQCKFSMPRFKKGTGRINLFRLLDLDNIATLETSMYGVNKKGKYEHCCYTIDMLKEIGRDVCVGMLNYVYQCEGIRLKNISFEDFVKGEIKEEMETIEEYKNMEEDSDSEPSIDNFDEKKINALLPKKNKKKKKRKRKSKARVETVKKEKKVNDDFDENFELFKPKNNETQVDKPKPATAKPKPFTANIKPKTNLKNKIAINCKMNVESRLFKKKETDENSNTKKYSVELTRDVGTQTEAIFFKMHWSFFVKDYVILEGRSFTPQRKKNLMSSRSYGQMSNSVNHSRYPTNMNKNRFGGLYTNRVFSKPGCRNNNSHRMNISTNNNVMKNYSNEAGFVKTNRPGWNGISNNKYINKFFHQTGRLFNPTKLWDN